MGSYDEVAADGALASMGLVHVSHARLLSAVLDQAWVTSLMTLSRPRLRPERPLATVSKSDVLPAVSLAISRWRPVASCGAVSCIAARDGAGLGAHLVVHG